MATMPSLAPLCHLLSVLILSTTSYSYAPWSVHKTKMDSGVQSVFQARHHHLAASSTTNDEDGTVPPNLNRRPKVIVFDLDGCLWRPEMYELLWEGRGAPFSPIDDDDLTKLKSATGTVVELVGDVAEVLDELYTSPEWSGTISALSSRTDEPSWARELLQKFTLPLSQVTLEQVFTGPREIAHDSKTLHFARIAASTGVDMTDMVFLDNEIGNCRQISKLGVTVAHCPEGVTREVFDRVIECFPSMWGEVVS